MKFRKILHRIKLTKARDKKDLKCYFNKKDYMYIQIQEGTTKKWSWNYQKKKNPQIHEKWVKGESPNLTQQGGTFNPIIETQTYCTLLAQQLRNSKT